MGLDEFKEEKQRDAESFKKYSLNDKDKRLKQIVEEFKPKMPYNFKIDFIEASPAIQGEKCWIYEREDGEIFFIRVGTDLFDLPQSSMENRVKLALIRLYAYQNNNSGESDITEKITFWIAGNLELDISPYINTATWNKTCSNFLNS